MKVISLFLFPIFVGFVVCAQRIIDIPSNFLIGAASSAHQVEGAWNEDGKGESNWDRFMHQKFPGSENGDVSCDSYHKVDEDVKIIKNVGVNFYRFSISWPRLLPTGFPNKINQAAVNYYNNLIDRLLENNITPVVTLYHFDMPQSLKDFGGFSNPLFANWFEDYAEISFSIFGDRVKLWITINEPTEICNYGYALGLSAPELTLSGIAKYICSKNLLIAHARVYHLYNNFFKTTQNGKIGILNECAWSEPATNKTEDIEAAERRMQFEFGLYAHPVFSKDGDYPKLVKDIVLKRSLAEGFKKSRLPELSADEIEYIKGTSDFFGINHYTTYMVSNREPYPIGKPSSKKDVQINEFQKDSWLTGFHPLGVFRLVPWGLRKILNYIKTNYNNPDIYVFENGFPDSGEIQDNDRIRFYKESLEALFDAVLEDGVSVKAFTVWSLMDSYEWIFAYKPKFGLYNVDFKNPNRTRTPKASVQFFKDLISTRKLILEEPSIDSDEVMP